MKQRGKILTLILLFVSLSFGIEAQNSVGSKITLKLDNTPMNKALEKIEELSGYLLQHPATVILEKSMKLGAPGTAEKVKQFI